MNTIVITFRKLTFGTRYSEPVTAKDIFVTVFGLVCLVGISILLMI